ncbi:hypothetical protein [Albirhodobacter sp. R86504]|uniref:hypothetical protein n=1 Tax=Albirhodobacter sp. R86504 TaxID=3093848 RepID=UPI003672F3B6
MRKTSLFLVGLVAGFLASAPAFADVTRNMTACLQDGPYKPKRQTVVLVDGAIIEDSDTKGALPFWRTELARFVNAQASEAAVLMAPHEQVSLGMLKPDGSGVNIFFEGCLPLLAPKEIEELRNTETKLDWFLGNGWEDRNSEIAEDFAKSTAISAVVAARALAAVAPMESIRFAESPLLASLRNFAGVDLNAGIPRLVLITDISKYGMPDGTTEALVTAGHIDGAKTGLHLGYSELHLLSKGSPTSKGAFDYASALFLASEARLKTLATAGGALTNVGAPVDVRVFQGSIVMQSNPEIVLPIRMRVAWDLNNTLVNSWMEETQGKIRYTPFSGSLSCTADKQCEFIGDGLFAQVWAKKNGDEPECLNLNERLPFGGFRNLTFKIDEDTMKGSVADQTCFFDGMDKGLPFEMREVVDGRM